MRKSGLVIFSALIIFVIIFVVVLFRIGAATVSGPIDDHSNTHIVLHLVR